MFIFYFGHMPVIDSKTAKYNFDNADDVAEKQQTNLYLFCFLLFMAICKVVKIWSFFVSNAWVLFEQKIMLPYVCSLFFESCPRGTKNQILLAYEPSFLTTF